MSIRQLFQTGLLVLLAIAFRPAHAGVVVIDSCGAVLSEPGQYKLISDITSCSGFAVLIIASDVSLNMAGHVISCARIDGVYDVGIEINGVSGVHVRNGTVANCDIGVELFQSHHSKINNLTVTGNILDPFFGIGLGIVGFEATHNKIVGNYALGNTSGIEFFFGGNNRIVGNVANENFRADNSPFPSYGIGIAAAFSDNNVILGNEVNRNSDAGIAVANGSTGNVIRDNEALANENYGIGMFSREDLGAPLATGNVIQSNVSLGNGRTDMLEARFDPFAIPREIVQPNCTNAWKNNTFDSNIAPSGCID